MIPLLTSAQIREVDAHTIKNEPISSIDLMERASKAFAALFTDEFPDKDKRITIYCGTGNNGGDGLAIARLLKQAKYVNLSIKIARFTEKVSPDFEVNYEKAKKAGILITEIGNDSELPQESSHILIDALLGTGLNKPLSGNYVKLVEHLNCLNKTVVAVDVPTGFFTEGEMEPRAVVLKAKLVITFQQPKINFLLPESADCMKRFEVADIGLDKEYIASLDSPYQLIEESDVKILLKPRKQFSHKGTYGHALIIAGQPQTMGAALLCSSACVHTGAGLTTAYIPEGGLTALNTLLPEVMAEIRPPGREKPTIKLNKYSTIAIGPGLGTDTPSFTLFDSLLREYTNPMVIDADALNILTSNSYLFKRLPVGTIITPHVKEFDRLFGEHKTWWARLQTVRQKAKELNIHILLKNRYTIIGTPGGKIYFNPTGNPAMASGGMGDVLTGVIVSLLAQKYTSEQACIIGAYLHGKTGDELALPNKASTVLAGQLAAHIPFTLAKLMA